MYSAYTAICVTETQVARRPGLSEPDQLKVANNSTSSYNQLQRAH